LEQAGQFVVDRKEPEEYSTPERVSRTSEPECSNNLSCSRNALRLRLTKR